VPDSRSYRVHALSLVGRRNGDLWIATPADLLKCLARAGKRVSLGMNKPLDIERQFHVTAAVKPLSGTAFVGLELRKLGLPETQDVGFHFANARDITNLEIETVWDLG
jgi:hypothetical protein